MNGTSNSVQQNMTSDLKALLLSHMEKTDSSVICLVFVVGSARRKQ